MNGIAHELTTLAALDSLPAWQQQLWAPERTHLAREYSLYGDTYAVRKAELAPYVELPDGSVPDFYMPKLRWKHHCAPAIDYWESPFYERTELTFRHFSEHIVAALRQGDVTTAAKFAGTYAHYIEDNACPGHAMDDTDLEIVKDLLPPPERLRRFPFHPRMETSPVAFSVSDRAPRLLGHAVPEAASVFVGRLVALTLASRATVLPFFQSFYEGNQERVAELNLGNCRRAAALLADFLHTVTCIAGERFDETAGESVTAARSLIELHPYRQTAWAPEPYAQTAPGELIGVNLNTGYEPVPCALRYQVGGVSRIEARPEALGATAHYEYEFRMPAGSYRQLAVEYGIHAELGSRYPMVFAVYCDDRLLHQDEKRPDEAASSVTIAWPAEGERLRLVTTLDPAIDVLRVSGRPVTPTGHAVWANPSLLR